MAEPALTIRSVAWKELFPWLILFRSVRIALMARVLILGAIGLIVTSLGWNLLSHFYRDTSDPVLKQWAQSSGWLWEDRDSGLSISTTARNAEQVYDSAASDLKQAPVEAWLFLTWPFRELFDARLTLSGFICLLIACLWELLVWGIVGGAISRIAALKFTRDESLGPVEALKHAARKITSYGLAPPAALAGAAVFAIQLVVLGALMNWSVFAMLAGIAWPFVLVLGLLMAILLIGALVGWPLMWATVSVEGTDGFDALSRSYAYVYQRPWRLLWYVFLSVLLAAVSMFVVKGFATGAIALGNWSVSWGLVKENRERIGFPTTPPATNNGLPNTFHATPSLAPPSLDTPQLPAGPTIAPPIVGPDLGDLPPPDASVAAAAAAPTTEVPAWPWSVARSAINFWQSLWKAIAAGFQVAYVWVAGVGIYLLLRRDIDGAEMDEVYMEQEPEYGIPPLEQDAATGVPEVAANKPAQAGDIGTSG